MKKIMFNDRYGLTEAVLTGRKTMTRRILPDIVLDWNRRGEVHVKNIHMEHGVLMMDLSHILDEPYITAAPKKYQPRYEIGEIVAVAQCYRDLSDSHFSNLSTRGINLCEQKDGTLKGLIELPGWMNKMFVRADAMPHRIRITDIKVERLQDISDADALREGITTITKRRKGVGNGYGWDTKIEAFKRDTFFTPRAAFADLIDRISGKGTWERNPYVFAYTFELVK